MSTKKTTTEIDSFLSHWKEYDTGTFDKNGLISLLEKYNEHIHFKDLEHHYHVSVGLFATDRPDLVDDSMHRVLFEITELDSMKETTKNVSVCPYVDETEEIVHSYLVISKKSPWDADESEMVEVKDNAESHKLLKLLEKHFGIPNRHKG